MKKVNRYSISVESGINSGYGNYSRIREMSSNRSIAFGRTCVGINFVANRKSYFDISYEYQPVRFNTSANLPAHRNFLQRNSLDGRPPWNSSTHISGNRDALYSFPERLKSISKESKLFAKENRLESPRPIRSTYLGYTNAGNVSGGGSEFFGRPSAGLPNPKSINNSVANCLNWDLMAPAIRQYSTTDVKRNFTSSQSNLTLASP